VQDREGLFAHLFSAQIKTTHKRVLACSGGSKDAQDAQVARGVRRWSKLKEWQVALPGARRITTILRSIGISLTGYC